MTELEQAIEWWLMLGDSMKTRMAWEYQMMRPLKDEQILQIYCSHFKLVSENVNKDKN